MSLERKEIFEFGEFRLDADEHTIERIDGTPSGTLTEKAFQTLVLLIRRRGHLVPKDELIQYVWPDTIVDEANLKNLIRELRTALGDDAKEPRFIRTASRYGYAFACEPATPGFLLSYAGTVFALCDGEHVIGRSPKVSVPIDSPHISRRHARIIIARGVATVEDLGSKNGTYVNGVKIEGSHALREGDEIKLADVIALRLRMAPGGESTITKSG